MDCQSEWGPVLLVLHAAGSGGSGAEGDSSAPCAARSREDSGASWESARVSQGPPPPRGEEAGRRGGVLPGPPNTARSREGHAVSGSWARTRGPPKYVAPGCACAEQGRRELLCGSIVVAQGRHIC